MAAFTSASVLRAFEHRRRDLGDLNGLVSVAGPEPGEARLLSTAYPAIERLVRSLDPLQDSAPNLEAHLFPLRQVSTDLGKGPALVEVDYGLSRHAPGVPSLLKRGVVQDRTLHEGGVKTLMTSACAIPAILVCPVLSHGCLSSDDMYRQPLYIIPKLFLLIMNSQRPSVGNR